VSLEKRLQSYTPETLRQLRRGIEKESLRVLPTGALALTPHPAPLGSALTHPRITTDYSESQLELITGPHGDVRGCVQDVATEALACVLEGEFEMVAVDAAGRPRRMARLAEAISEEIV